MSLFTRTNQETHCPYKGDCAYYTIGVDGQKRQNAAWTYEHPYEAVAAIQNCLAFYPDRVDRIEEEAPQTSA